MKRIAGVLAAFTIVAVLHGQTPPPVPVFDGIQVESRCTLASDGNLFQYTYFFINPATNNEPLGFTAIPLGELYPAKNLSWPLGWSCLPEDLRTASEFVPNESQVFSCTPVQSQGYGAPGSRSGPFSFTSYGFPRLREVWFNPNLPPYFRAYLDYLEAAGKDVDVEAPFPDFELSLKRSYPRKVPALVPSSQMRFSYEHWDQLLEDVGKLKELGWLAPALADAVLAKLHEGRAAAGAGDGQTVVARLTEVVQLMEQADRSQYRAEAWDLVVLNAKDLRDSVRWTVPCEPQLVLTPKKASRSLGESQVVSARLFNRATGLPMAEERVTIKVLDGPHAGTVIEGLTDAQGQLTLTYAGRQEGKDRVRAYGPAGSEETLHVTPLAKEFAAKRGVAEEDLARIWAKVKEPHPKPLGEKPKVKAAGLSTECHLPPSAEGPLVSDEGVVEWRGGPDLAVPFFTPPALVSAPGAEFVMNEATTNLGNKAAPPSVTRYYIATHWPVDRSQAVVVGEREVPALAPGEASEKRQMVFRVPSSLPPGDYYLDACADALGAVMETDEQNNCASSRVFLSIGGMAVPPNRPPVCAAATAEPSLLWPPNHKFVEVAIGGVSDPDGDAVTLTITGITQDEPTEGLGDGDMCPDAEVLAGGNVRLRAERSGLGNGRVYVVSFTGSDGKGGRCTGSVRVGVPHDRSRQPVDSGQNHDARLCPGQGAHR